MGSASPASLGLNPIERLRHGLGSFTRSEEAAARFFLEHPSFVVNKTISKAAEEAGLTSTAIMRMCQRIGYSGYAEFRFSMNRYMLSSGVGTPEAGEPGDHLRLLSDTYGAYARRLVDGVDRDQLHRFAQAIASARRISIWGANRTYESVKQLSLRLMRIGIFNQTTSDPQVMDDISTILCEGDLCVILTVSGRGCPNYSSLVESLTERGCTVFVVTMNPKLSVARKATEAVVVPWVSNENVSGFFEDQIIFFLYLECLLHEVAGIAGGQ